MAILIPRCSALKPVRAVKTTPPMPVAVVIMPVEKAVFFPAKGIIILRTHG